MESSGLYCCFSHYCFCCFHKPRVPEATAAPSPRNSDAKVILVQEESAAPSTPSRNKLPTLTRLSAWQVLTCSSHSQPPLAPLYQQYKSGNTETDCTSCCKKRQYRKSNPSPSRSFSSYFADNSHMATGKRLFWNKAVSKKLIF